MGPSSKLPLPSNSLALATCTSFSQSFVRWASAPCNGDGPEFPKSRYLRCTKGNQPFQRSVIPPNLLSRFHECHAVREPRLSFFLKGGSPIREQGDQKSKRRLNSISRGVPLPVGVVLKAPLINPKLPGTICNAPFEPALEDRLTTGLPS
jgi:hypothetical protein